MKKINSIHYGNRLLAAGLIFLVPVPLVLSAINRTMNSEIMSGAGIGSIAAGAVIELTMAVILAIESHQDRTIDEYYGKNPQSGKTPQQILDERRKPYLRLRNKQHN